MRVQLWSFLKGQGLRLRSNGSPGPACRSLTPPSQHHPPPSPGSLHPLRLAKGTEGGGRGTAEKTRVCRTAFEHRRSAAPLSETYSGGTAGRNAHVYTATGSDAAVGTGTNRPHAYHGPPNMNPQWESAAQLCSHLLLAVGTVGGGSSDF